MSRVTKFLRKLKLFFKVHPRYLRGLVGAFILLGGFVLFLAVTGSQLPATVWLPATNQSMSDDDVIFNLPVKSQTATTRYGRAIRYTTTTNLKTQVDNSQPWITILEFHATSLLKAIDCPNITNFETLLPSACENLGTFQGQPVFSIHRSLPSGATEYYVKLGTTFIYVKSGGDGGQSLDYIRTFISMNRETTSSYLARTSGRVDQILAKQKAESIATTKNNDLAYTRLDFTPALPTSLPSGWHLNTAAANPIEIDGPDADHPALVNLLYVDGNKQFISMHIGKLSSFMLETQCGPSPGYSMKYLNCQKVAGTDYYESSSYDDRNDFLRYLYRPVGDSIVITSINLLATDNKKPDFPTKLAKIQDEITESAQPADLSQLKGSTYSKTYY